MFFKISDSIPFIIKTFFEISARAGAVLEMNRSLCGPANLLSLILILLHIFSFIKKKKFYFKVFNLQVC